jgi:hypothetical protein
VNLIGVLLIDGLRGIAVEVGIQLLGDERGSGENGEEERQFGWTHVTSGGVLGAGFL